MKIAFNPSTVAALTSPPDNKDITFDLRGHNIFARGVKFYGTDTNTWRDIKINNVSIGSHTLDLRNGGNTTLTNTNGVVTINSTWRPVVDNLTSNSATSSLSANLGRVLKALIDGKSDLDHNHDGRYVKRSGDTMLGALNFANNTWNRVGDNVYMGDHNIGGQLCIMGANGTTGLSFHKYGDASIRKSITFDGNTLYMNGNCDYATLSNLTNLLAINTVPNKTAATSIGSWSPISGRYVFHQKWTDTSTGGDSADFGIYLDGNLTANMVLDGYYNSLLGFRVIGATSGFLKANGTIDNSTYLTSHLSLSNYYTKSEVDTKLNSKLNYRLFWERTNIDLNNITEAWHTYEVNNGTGTANTPTNASWHQAVLWGTGDTDYAVLLCTAYTSNYSLYLRHKIAGKWYNWIQLAATTDIPSSLKNPYALTISLNGTSQGPYDGSAAKNINITPGSIGAATSGHNHDDRYLKLTGGTMTGTIYRNSGGSTISGRDHAIIRLTYAPGGSSWNPIACVDTETGTWTLGHLSSGDSDTNFHFCFSTNTDYNAGNNNGNYVTLRNKVGTIALLSEIPDKNSWNYDDRYLKLTGGTMNGNARIGHGSGNLYIGNSGNDGWVAVQDICSQDSIGDGNWSLRTNGTAHFQSINFPSNRLIAQVSNGSNSPLKGIKLPYLENNGIGIFSRVGNGADEGGIVLSEDTCVIYNSFDAGWGLSVRDKDLNQTDISSDDTVAFGIRENYKLYSRGGFEKSGSNNSYVLLGGGDHKLESSLNVANTNTMLIKSKTTENDCIPSVERVGCYYASPCTAHTGDAFILAFNTNNYIAQLAIDVDRTNKMAVRMITPSNTWTSWASVITSDNIGSQSVNYASSAGNADTLDGEHASSFVRAGHYESLDLNKLDTYSFIRSVNSNNKDTSPKGSIGWYNVILLVHRNGAGDGPSYIGLIALGMTTNTDDMFFRGKRTDPWKTVIHSGNIGSQSVNYAASAGNADTLDGYHANGSNVAPYGHIPTIESDGVMEVGKYIDFHNDNSGKHDFSTRLQSSGNYGNSVNLPSNYGTLALITDNVASATKLQTARKIWGLSFDGTADIPISVAAKMPHVLFKRFDNDENAGYIGRGSSGNNNIYIESYINSNIILDGNNIGIGAYNPAYKLHVAGDIYSSATIRTAAKNQAIVLSNDSNPAWISALDGQVIFNTGNAIRFGETAWNFDEWAGLKYTHSNKTIYLGIADGSVFNSNNTLSRGTLNLRAGISNIDLNSGTSIRGLPTDGSPYSSSITLRNVSMSLSAYGDISMSTGPGVIKLGSGYGGIKLSCLGNNASIDSEGFKVEASQGVYLNYRNSGNIYLCLGGGKVGIGTNSPTYKLDVNGLMRAEGFHHWTVNSDNYMLLAGGGYKSFGGDDNNPIFLGYLNLDHGNDGTVSSSFSCLGYSVPFTYTRGGNYCRIYIPNTTHQVFYIKAAIASVNYSGGRMDTWVGHHRGSGAWWLHCYASGDNEVKVKGFRQSDSNNDSWWGGNPLWSANDGANKITVCIFGYVKFR